MIPERGAYRGQSYRLFDDYNHVHVFIEDAGFENLYEVILSRSGMPVRKVFSKNGKTEVLSAAETCADPKCVYVVDRDWDDLLGSKCMLKNVVVLKMHSIESFLVDYSGFAQLVVGQYPRADIAQVLGTSRYKDIVTEVSRRLRPLFECFAAMQLTGKRGKGCSHNPGCFQERNKCRAPDESKIAEFIANARVPVPGAVVKYFSGDVLRERGHGKYMLHYVWASVRNAANLLQLDCDQLKMRLAQVVDPSVFDSLSDDLKRVIARRERKKRTSKVAQ